MIDRSCAEFDIAFVNPAHHGTDYYSPIGIGMLDKLVRAAGYKSTVVDFQRAVVLGRMPWPERFFDAAVATIAEVSARVFAFSVMNVGFPWACRLANSVKRHHPHARVVFGGPHATLLAREILELYPDVDVVARREGDQLIVPLLRTLLSGTMDDMRNVRGIVFRDESQRIIETPPAPYSDDLDQLPMLDLDADLLNNVGIISVEAGRGCPYHCTFCSSHAVWTRQPRFKSPERLVEEAARYADQSPYDLVISYEHDDFLSNRPLFRRFVEYKQRTGRRFKYAITTRINHITPEIRDLLVSSGCVSVFMGLETGSPLLQRSSGKRLHLDRTFPDVVDLVRHGIHVTANFIVGFPDETLEDLLQSFEFMVRLTQAGAGVNISIMCPEPGSDLYSIVPTTDHLLLTDGTYANELRRGGFDVERLPLPERSHLMTIRNRNYDIHDVARISRMLQLLMAAFPLSLSNAASACGGLRVFVDRLFGKCPAVPTPEDAFGVLSPPILASSAPRATEFLLYEQASALHRRRGVRTLGPEAFSSDMPEAYFHARTRLAEAASGVPQDAPAPVYAEEAWTPTA